MMHGLFGLGQQMGARFQRPMPTVGGQQPFMMPQMGGPFVNHQTGGAATGPMVKQNIVDAIMRGRMGGGNR